MEYLTIAEAAKELGLTQRALTLDIQTSRLAAEKRPAKNAAGFVYVLSREMVETRRGRKRGTDPTRIGATEAAKKIGVSRQTVYAMRDDARYAVLGWDAATSTFDRDAVTRYARKRLRAPIGVPIFP